MANSLAYILDGGEDGAAEQFKVQKNLFDYWINCGDSRAREDAGNGIMKGNLGCQHWKVWDGL